MDREEGRTHRGIACNKLPKPDLLLQWGNRKRLRCVNIKEDDGSSVIKKKLKSRIDRRVVRGDNHTPPPPSPYRLPSRGYEASTPGNSQSCSPEKEEKCVVCLHNQYRLAQEFFICASFETEHNGA